METLTIRHGYLEGLEFELEQPTAEMPDGSNDLLELVGYGNMAAMKAVMEGGYTNEDAPFYYGKIRNEEGRGFGHIVSHADLYDKIRHRESKASDHAPTPLQGAMVITLEPGHNVVCDDCNKDYTDSDELGGLQFQSKAIGPCCVQSWLDGAKKHSEEHFIRARCPDGKSFADWVREDLR